MLSIAVVQTKVISCNSANKSCLLQVVHTKAIAALTQFCDFLISNASTLLAFFCKCHNAHYFSIQTPRGPCMHGSNAQASLGARTAKCAFHNICLLLSSCEIYMLELTSSWFSFSSNKL